MTIPSVSIQLGVLSGLGSVVLQSTAPVSGGPSMTAVLVPVVSAVIGGLMSYAVLKTTVEKMEQDVRDMRHSVGEIYALLRDSMTKIARIEGRLESPSHD